MIRPISVEPLGKYRIWLQYSDGVSGEIDLSDVAGRGVFQAWDKPGCFERVYIAPHRATAWGEDIELCPESLYIELTGKPPDQIWPGAGSSLPSA